MAREQKGEQSATAYFTKMKGLVDEMAAAGKKLEDDDVVSYILNGLDSDYNAFVSSIMSKEEVTLSDLYAQLLAYEARLEQQNSGSFGSSANSAYRGGRGQGRGRGRGRGRGDFGRGGAGHCGRGGRGNDGESVRPTCQLCGREGHVVQSCYKRFDMNFTGEEVPQRSAAAASTSYGGNYNGSYGIDTNWYMDTGSTDHIIGELEKLTTREKYRGQDKFIRQVVQV